MAFASLFVAFPDHGRRDRACSIILRAPKSRTEGRDIRRRVALYLFAVAGLTAAVSHAAIAQSLGGWGVVLIHG